MLYNLLEEFHLRFAFRNMICNSWVDDLSAAFWGTAAGCVDTAVVAGLYVVREAERLGLRISPKSTVVANSRPLAIQIAEGINGRLGRTVVTTEEHGKDLGITTVAGGKRRRVKDQASRRGKMGKRLKVIKGLISKNKKCRVMLWVGAKPQGTWGHQGMGLSPTTLARIRQKMAASGLIHRPGGCTTTGFGLITGHQKDPGISLVQELLVTWIQVLEKSTIPKEAIQRAWAKTTKELKEAPRRWHKVRGTMGATIATLLDRGWDQNGRTNGETGTGKSGVFHQADQEENNS